LLGFQNHDYQTQNVSKECYICDEFNQRHSSKSLLARGVVGWERFPTQFCTIVTLFEDSDFSFQFLCVADCENKSFLRVRASKEYLVLSSALA